MYHYLYDGHQHTDTSTDYLTKLGMDEEGVEALQRDAEEYDRCQYADFITQRNGMLDDSDWLVLCHQDQSGIGKTTLTDQQFTMILAWRQSLRDMPETMKNRLTIVWPELPPFLEDEFPDYPPK